MSFFYDSNIVEYKGLIGVITIREDVVGEGLQYIRLVKLFMVKDLLGMKMEIIISGHGHNGYTRQVLSCME